MLDCLRQGITVQAAAAVQHKWENEVLSSPAALYEGHNLEALYGKDGVVTTFMGSVLSPLIRRQDAAPAAAFWDGTPFPFTSDFLGGHVARRIRGRRPSARVLRRAAALAAPPYSTGTPPSAPDSTEFYLRCNEGPQRLINNNYPRSGRIHYAEGACAAAGIILRFPDIELQYEYPDFLTFLKDFQYGERTFSPEDFPAAAEKLNAISVRSMTVRLLPDNAAALLEARENAPSTLPERIVYTW